MALGKKSRDSLKGVHSDLKRLAYEMSRVVDAEKKRRGGVYKFDFSVRDGVRGEREQNKAFDSGNSKVRYPDGKHNKKPSQAIHFLPYPVRWPQPIKLIPGESALISEYSIKKFKKELKNYSKQLGRFYQLIGFVQAVATSLNIKVRSGSDWNRDGDIMDQNFDDLAHWEVVID